MGAETIGVISPIIVALLTFAGVQLGQRVKREELSRQDWATLTGELRSSIEELKKDVASYRQETTQLREEVGQLRMKLTNLRGLLDVAVIALRRWERWHATGASGEPPRFPEELAEHY